jgi:hypothetical protein
MRRWRLSLILMRLIRFRKCCKIYFYWRELVTANGCSNTFMSLRAFVSANPGTSRSSLYPAFATFDKDPNDTSSD